MRAFRARELSSFWEWRLHFYPSLTSQINAQTEAHSYHAELLLRLPLKALFALCPLHDSDTRVHRCVRSSRASAFIWSFSFVKFANTMSVLTWLNKAYSGHSASRSFSLLNLTGIISQSYLFFFFFLCAVLWKVQRKCWYCILVYCIKSKNIGMFLDSVSNISFEIGQIRAHWASKRRNKPPLHEKYT